jgi:SulP family sulfate permease
VKQDLLGALRAAGIVDRIGADRLFPTLPTAVAAYDEWNQTRNAGKDQPRETLTERAQAAWTEVHATC